MDTFIRNLRYALRALSRSPGYTFTVILTLALAIGANTAVLSVIDAVLLRPLPFPDPDRLVYLKEERELEQTYVGVLRLEDWNRMNSTFQAISGYGISDGTDTSGDLPVKTQYASVMPRFLDVLGVNPALGGNFTSDEHRAGGPSAIIVSERTWHSRFNADPDILGKPIPGEDVFGEFTFTIKGVMPGAFKFPGDVDMWVSDKVDATWLQRNPTYSYVRAIGRLKPGVTLEQARTDLAVVQAQLAEQYPDSDKDIKVHIEPLRDALVGETNRSLWLLFGAVSVLLLIACTNIAALMLARASQREHEVAVRYSLGAKRTAVVKQILTEAAVLAFAGAVFGLVLAIAATSLFRAVAPDLPRMDELAIDGRIVLYTVFSTVVVTLLCGLLPAVRSTRSGYALSGSGRGQVSSRHTAQWLLVIIQVAMSVILLAGAGLLVRSINELSHVDPGFDPEGLLAFRIYGSYLEDYGRAKQRINNTMHELESMPGIDAAATANAMPGSPRQGRSQFELDEGRAGPEAPLVAAPLAVSSSYFRTLGIPLLAGELCRQPEGNRSGEVMVNSIFVNRYFPGRNVIGLHLSGPGIFANPGSGVRIAGIVGDTRELGIDREPVPAVYLCNEAPSQLPLYLVRTAGDPMAVAQAVRRKMYELEPLRAVYDIAPLTETIGNAYAENRLRTWLLVFFAAAALSLACLGVFSTLSYIVSQRRREVGLRMALGAVRRNIVAQFMMKALRVAGIACVAGLALSFAFTRVLSGMLYGVSPSDPVTIVSVIIIVFVVAALASFMPARRAARLDPMQTLREE
jgi:putative ABC transport system permease protein